jgi:hypothetical protein
MNGTTRITLHADGTMSSNGYVALVADRWYIIECLIIAPDVSGLERHLRRLRGYHPESPRRSAMHAAYRRRRR